LDPCERLAKRGFEVTVLPVSENGLLDLDELRKVLRDQTLLVSVMAANNEIGVLQPLQAVGKLCQERGILFHTDAVQALGKIPIDVEKYGIDLLSLSAHKLYGPKGVGALYLRSRRPRVRLEPLLFGGGHERGLRSGTLPVPLIVGFGRAVQIAQAEMKSEGEKLVQLRDCLLQGLREKLDGVEVNGELEERLPGNLNLAFAGIDADQVLVELKEVALSTGSACTSAMPEPSHVLQALGHSPERVRSSIRFGIGRENTREEIDWVIGKLSQVVAKLRA